jgi:ribonuclease R
MRVAPRRETCHGAAVKSSPLRERILAELKSPTYRPIDRQEFAKVLKLNGSTRRQLVDIFLELEEEGIVICNSRGRYLLPGVADVATGVLQVHGGGNAHLLCETPGIKDLFVPAAHLGTAMHSDKVVVRIERGRKGELEGRVIRVLERATSTVVGTLQRGKSCFFVAPDDSRMQRDVNVSSPKEGKVGDKVVVKLEAWTDPRANPEGEIVEVLGAATDPGVDMLSIVRKHNLPLEFPPAVLQEADRIPETIPESEIAKRTDCRGDFVVTIDPDDAKDFDDAIMVVRRPDGGWRLCVHIADVSHYVRPGTALDREARLRGNSTYLADRVIPMLPERLSNGVCSLKPKVDRLTTAAFIDFDRTGAIKKASFARSVIHSAARLTYRQALAILEDKPVPPTPNYERGGRVHLDAKPVPIDVTPELRERVHTAWELASVLRRRRFEQGSLDLDFPEVKIWLDDQGRADRMERLENDISHQLVEECMLAANEVVAKEIKNRNSPSIYRIHEDPDSDRLSEFRDFAAQNGFKAGDLTQRREVQKILAAIKGTHEEYAVKLQFLKSLKRAAYDINSVGHYGLAKVNYTHFTSPIRRYADLVVHRVISRLKAGDAKSLGELAAHISKTERTSSDAERDSTQLKKMEFFQRQLTSKKPQEFPAIVVDVRAMGIFVELPDVQISGLVHVSALGQDFFEFDAVRQRYVGRKTKYTYKLGDKITVVVARVDAYRRQIDFAPVLPAELVGSEEGASTANRTRDKERPARNQERGRRKENERRPAGEGRPVSDGRPARGGRGRAPSTTAPAAKSPREDAGPAGESERSKRGSRRKRRR